MIELILTIGGIASAIAAVIALVTLIVRKAKSIIAYFKALESKIDNIDKHNHENYLSNLRLTIMSEEMPIGERLRAGEMYVSAGGNGEVKSFYKSLAKKYQDKLEGDIIAE